MFSYTVLYIFMYVCMYACVHGHDFHLSIDQPSKVANPALGQLDRENGNIFRVRVCAQEFGRETMRLAVPRTQATSIVAINTHAVIGSIWLRLP